MLRDQQVLDIVNALLDHEGVCRGMRVQHLLARRGVASLHALGPLVEHYLEHEFERNYLVRVMERAGGSVSEGARLFGLDRTNFRRLLQRHGLRS